MLKKGKIKDNNTQKMYTSLKKHHEINKKVEKKEMLAVKLKQQ